MLLLDALLVLGALGLLLLVFVALAEICDEFLCPSIEVLCDRLKIPHDVAGATFIAFGCSASEIALNSWGTAQGQSALSLSALLGSGLIAFGFIPPLCAWQAGKLRLAFWPVLRDVFAFAVAVTLLLTCVEAGDLGPRRSALLCAIFLCYVLAVSVPACLRSGGGDEEADVVAGVHGESLPFAHPSVPPSSQTHTSLGDAIAAGAGKGGLAVPVDTRSTHSYSCSEADLESELEEGSEDGEERSLLLRMWKKLEEPVEAVLRRLIPDCSEEFGSPDRYWRTLLVCLVLITGLAELSLYLCSHVASLLHLTHTTAGATLLALGAQVEDIICCVALTRAGMVDAAVSNAVGSQVINLTIGAGLPPLAFYWANGRPVELSSSSLANLNALAYALLAVVLAYGIAVFTYCSDGHLAGLTRRSGAFLFVVWLGATVAFFSVQQE